MSTRKIDLASPERERQEPYFSSLIAPCSLQVLPSLTLGARPLFFLLSQPCKDAEVFKRRRVARRFTPCSDVAKQSPHDFARPRLRQGIGEANFVGSRQ